jgi:hypothetical protein
LQASGRLAKLTSVGRERRKAIPARSHLPGSPNE